MTAAARATGQSSAALTGGFDEGISDSGRLAAGLRLILSAVHGLAVDDRCAVLPLSLGATQWPAGSAAGPGSRPGGEPAHPLFQRGGAHRGNHCLCRPAGLSEL